MKIGDIFEIVWEEEKQTNGYFFVKIKLVPIGKNALEDILDYFRKFGCVRHYEEYEIKRFFKHRGRRYLEIFLVNVGQYDHITLDKKEGIAYHECGGGHYITQHWADILPKNTKEFTHRQIANARGSSIKFITRHHGTFELDTEIIDHYFVSGFKGQGNDKCFGDAAKAMVDIINEKKAVKQ